MRSKKNSVQRLIGFERFTKYGVQTDRYEFAFFGIEPTNISVLSATNIEAKIHHLTMLLSMIPDLELTALDSADFDFLDEIQTEMSSARQFVFCVRFRRENDEQIFKSVNRIEKFIAE